MTTLPDVLPLDRPMLGCDLETTGVNRATARIIEVGFEIMRPGFETKEYRTLVNPGVPIPAEATAINHITDDMVKDAPTFEQLADNLLLGMVGCDYCGYNVRFDLGIFDAEFKRSGCRWTYEGARVIDGFRLWQIAEGRTLTHAVERWLKGGDPCVGHGEVADESAHTALWDVKMSTRIIAAQLRQCPQLPRDVQQLHDLCAPGWYDHEGKLQWRNGELCFTFGEHREKPLRSVPKGYLSWVAGKDFNNTVKSACRNAMRGVYPVPPI